MRLAGGPQPGPVPRAPGFQVGRVPSGGSLKDPIISELVQQHLGLVKPRAC